MSGAFARRRSYFEALAPRLGAIGFKIPFDLILGAPRPLHGLEAHCRFKKHRAGKSKRLVLAWFAGMLGSGLWHGLALTMLVFGAIGMARTFDAARRGWAFAGAAWNHTVASTPIRHAR